MNDLVTLKLGSENSIRCLNINEAKEKAIAYLDVEGKISLEITPESGGPMLSLQFDRAQLDWISES